MNDLTITDHLAAILKRTNYLLDKATYEDGAGNVITDTYATKTELLNLQLSGGAILPQVIVSSNSGNTVTVSDGNNTLTATEQSGTWLFNIPNFGDWTITTTDGQRSESKTISIDTVKIYNTSVYSTKRYGYRISKTEADPDARVEYLYDAVGMTPAHMVFDTDTNTAGTDSDTSYFDYGDWQNVWFVKDNKPCMLKYDGTVDYYLDPNDYSKKEDGSASDVANTSYGGNAMAQIPLCWIYRYEDNNYLYEIVSNVQWDENYKAYAHTDKDGNIKDYFYAAMFAASGSESKLRSLSGQAVSFYLVSSQQINGATANGAGWYIGTWSQRCLINTLLVLIGKSTDTQSVFGKGYMTRLSSSEPNSDRPLASGTLKDKGQFFGYTSSYKGVKVFHIENYWGSQWLRVAGVINNYGTLYAKMTPEGDGYQIDNVSGYTKVGTMPNIADNYAYNYINTMSCSEFGLFPKTANGSSTTYFCDTAWTNNSQLNLLNVGGGAPFYAAGGGAFGFDVTDSPTGIHWYLGYALSYV